jgi:hypothetical protein
MSSPRGTTPPAITKQDLVKAANRLLGGLASLRIATKAGADDAFEYWLWARTLSIARGMGLTVQIKEQQGGRVRLRTTPGTVTSGSYSYAEISSSTNRIELHTGVYVEGGSGADHEVDVVAIDKGAGRSSPLDHASLQLGFEAKLYSSKLPLSIPRAVLGTAYDLKTLPGYVRGPARLALVSSAPLSVAGRTLLASKRPSHPRVPAAESVRIGNCQAVDVFVTQHMSRLK